MWKPSMYLEIFYGHQVPAYLILALGEGSFLLNVSSLQDSKNPQRVFHLKINYIWTQWKLTEDTYPRVFTIWVTGSDKGQIISLYFPLRDTLNISSCQAEELPLVIISQKGISASRIYTLPRWAWNWILFRQSKHLWWFTSHHWTKKVKAQITTL